MRERQVGERLHFSGFETYSSQIIFKKRNIVIEVKSPTC